MASIYDGCYCFMSVLNFYQNFNIRHLQRFISMNIQWISNFYSNTSLLTGLQHTSFNSEVYLSLGQHLKQSKLKNRHRTDGYRLLTVFFCFAIQQNDKKWFLTPHSSMCVRLVTPLNYDTLSRKNQFMESPRNGNTFGEYRNLCFLVLFWCLRLFKIVI